jgi:hypothetical protein
MRILPVQPGRARGGKLDGNTVKQPADDRIHQRSPIPILMHIINQSKDTPKFRHLACRRVPEATI